MDGEVITYDAIGNPTSYHNGTWWSFGWEQGRQLATASNGTDTVSYTYDADGLRTSKTVNGTVHTYYYAGSKLLRETYGTNTLDFFYDASGYPFALKYNGDLYYYITNLQGDVMSIVDAQGEVVAAYEYDPYGNILTATGPLADVNPLRYRGYVYDNETNFYYLQSRYYDPEIARFLNADSYASTGQGVLGNNMFAYCLNNPIIYTDTTGCYPFEAAFEFLEEWLTGDGTTQRYSGKARIVKKLKKSKKMKAHIKTAIENYKNGQSTTTGTDEFTAGDDGYELYLSTQHFDYTITVTEETRTAGSLWWKHEEVRYIATVTVHDTYNFDTLREWDGFGNIMNNLAYIYHFLGGGKDFEWYATYTYATKWEDVT